ncbi:hypothetical protein HDU86_006306 [Geranomyces michiganensis]|nr:hypothetical protein HDU86_006306 [Geranomyces michiganensis]
MQTPAMDADPAAPALVRRLGRDVLSNCVLVLLEPPDLSVLALACRTTYRLTRDPHFRFHWVLQRILLRVALPYLLTKERDFTLTSLQLQAQQDRVRLLQAEHQRRANAFAELSSLHQILGQQEQELLWIPESRKPGSLCLFVGDLRKPAGLWEQDDHLHDFPYNLRLQGLPRAITADASVLELLLQREKLLANGGGGGSGSIAPEQPMLLAHAKAILAIARQAFWEGLIDLAGCFFADPALCRRVTAACQQQDSQKYVGPRGMLHPSPNPWDHFRTLAYVRGHLELVRCMIGLSSRLPSELWGSIEDSWVYDTCAALNHPTHSISSPVTILAFALDQFKPEPAVDKRKGLAFTAFNAGNLDAVNLLHERGLLRLVSSRLGEEYQYGQDPALLDLAMHGWKGKWKDFARAHTTADSIDTSLEMADLALLWKRFFDGILQLPEVRNFEHYISVMHSVFSCMGGDSEDPPLDHSVDVLVAFLKLMPRGKATDHICAPFIFVAEKTVPTSVHVLRRLVLPYWDREIVGTAAQAVLKEMLRICVNYRAQARWNAFKDIGTDDVEDSDTSDSEDSGTEMRRQGRNRWGWSELKVSVQRFGRELGDCCHGCGDDSQVKLTGVTSPEGANIKYVLRKGKPEDVEEFLNALQDAGESLAGEKETFRQWLEAEDARQRDNELTGWTPPQATWWLEWLLKLGLDVHKIGPEYRTWCKAHKVPLRLLAKHGSEWAAAEKEAEKKGRISA